MADVIERPDGAKRHFVTSARRGSTIGGTFDPRSNSLNTIRLALAIAVICSHSITLGGFGSETIVGHNTVGGIAVDGFFAISAFLITSSAARTNAVRYLWQRFLRIYPGAWVCVVAIAFVFAPIAWLNRHSSLHGFFTARDGPVPFVLHDVTLVKLQYNVSGTLAHLPFPNEWIGTFWTLKYEMMCYLIVLALAILGVLRSKRLLAAIGATSWALTIVLSLTGHAYNYASEQRFVPIFLVGGALWAWKDRLPDSGTLALLGVVIYGAGCHTAYPDIAAPALTYTFIWLGAHLPLQRIGARNDLSYGTYIYGFAVQQLFASWHFYHWGYVPYTAISIATTLLLAAGSWFLVERHALRLKRARAKIVFGRSRPRVDEVPPAATGGAIEVGVAEAT